MARSKSSSPALTVLFLFRLQTAHRREQSLEAVMVHALRQDKARATATLGNATRANFKTNRF